jgi:hypothetical protein
VGAWSALKLARTPDTTSGDSSLVFNAPTSGLSNVLTRDQLFLVIANPDPTVIDWSTIADGTNNIKIGGFAFLFDLNVAGSTALLFKFNNQMTLQDLVAQPSLWAEPDKFAPNQSQTQDLLSGLINQALTFTPQPGQPNPFGDFATIAVDRTWTGIIAFNVQVDGNQMAPDFQMLLGGMQADLRAHHIGIEANLLDPTTLAINQSSMFGVIYYPPPGVTPSPPQPSEGPDDVRYAVTELVVVFRNSAVTLFEATADLIVNIIFGRTVTSGPPGNAISIQGQYQIHGGVGIVTFQSTQEFDFSFADPGSTRVLDKLNISAARFVPITGASSGSMTPAPSALSTALTAVHCAFCLEGELWFAQTPFPGTEPVDLFSYGNATNNLGMAYTGLSVDIVFNLGADGSPTAPPTVTVDYPQLQPSPDFNAVRANSLLYSVPAQFSRFLAGPDVSNAAAASLPIHCNQLVGTGGGGTAANALAPLVTHNPTFALEYDVALGSLGSLSDGQATNAKLLIGWGASAYSPNNDAGGLLVQLPQLSAGISGISIEGVLQVQLGVGNLARITLDNGDIAYAILFNNAQLSAIGITLPPGILADVLIFTDTTNPQGNLAWFVAAGTETP